MMMMMMIMMMMMMVMMMMMMMMIVSEVHKQWGNEKRECMCLSLSLRFSLGTIKDDEHEGSPSLHIAFFLLRKTGDFTSVKLNRERKNCNKNLAPNRRN